VKGIVCKYIYLLDLQIEWLWIANIVHGKKKLVEFFCNGLVIMEPHFIDLTPYKIGSIYDKITCNTQQKPLFTWIAMTQSNHFKMNNSPKQK
jgi:hypothetical protein